MIQLAHSKDFSCHLSHTYTHSNMPVTSTSVPLVAPQVPVAKVPLNLHRSAVDIPVILDDVS